MLQLYEVMKFLSYGNLYHFQNVTTEVSRKDYEKKISIAVNASPNYNSKKKYKYAKEDPNNHEIMTTDESMESALGYAER